VSPYCRTLVFASQCKSSPDARPGGPNLFCLYFSRHLVATLMVPSACWACHLKCCVTCTEIHERMGESILQCVTFGGAGVLVEIMPFGSLRVFECVCAGEAGMCCVHSFLWLCRC